MTRPTPTGPADPGDGLEELSKAVWVAAIRAFPPNIAGDTMIAVLTEVLLRAIVATVRHNGGTHDQEVQMTGIVADGMKLAALIPT